MLIHHRDLGLGTKNKQGRNTFAPVGANTSKVANIPNPCPASAANGEGQHRRAQLVASVQVQASGGGPCKASSRECWTLRALPSLLALSFGLFAADRQSSAPFLSLFLTGCCPVSPARQTGTSVQTAWSTTARPPPSASTSRAPTPAAASRPRTPAPPELAGPVQASPPPSLPQALGRAPAPGSWLCGTAHISIRQDGRSAEGPPHC